MLKNSKVRCKKGHNVMYDAGVHKGKIYTIEDTSFGICMVNGWWYLNKDFEVITYNIDPKIKVL